MQSAYGRKFNIVQAFDMHIFPSFLIQIIHLVHRWDFHFFLQKKASNFSNAC